MVWSASPDNGSSFVSLGFVSGCRDLGASFGLHLSLSGWTGSFGRLSGLFVLLMSFSLVVTVNRSVLRSSTIRLAGRRFPDADRLWGGLVKPAWGERPVRESRESADARAVPEKAAPVRGLGLPSLSVPLERRSA